MYTATTSSCRRLFLKPEKLDPATTDGHFKICGRQEGPPSGSVRTGQGVRSWRWPRMGSYPHHRGADPRRSAQHLRGVSVAATWRPRRRRWWWTSPAAQELAPTRPAACPASSTSWLQQRRRPVAWVFPGAGLVTTGSLAFDTMMPSLIWMMRVTGRRHDGAWPRPHRQYRVVQRQELPYIELGLSLVARSGLVGSSSPGWSRQTVARNVTINNLLPGIFDSDAQCAEHPMHVGGWAVKSFAQIGRERAARTRRGVQRGVAV